MPASSTVVAGVAPGDTLTVQCTGLPTSATLTVTEQSPLASVVSPANLAADELDVQVQVSAGTDASGNLPATPFALPEAFDASSGFAATDPSAACPPNPTQLDAGLVACSLVVLDGTGTVLDQAQVLYAGQPQPQAPTLALSVGSGADGGTVAVQDAPAATSHWWGDPTQLVHIPASSILVGATPSTSSTVAVAPASYTVPVVSGTPQWATGSLQPPALSGSFTVPSESSSATTEVSIFESDVAAGVTGNSTNPSFPGEVTASAAFDVVDTGAATLSVDPGQGGTGSAVVVTGANWDPQGGPVSLSFSQTPASPFAQIGSDTATATVQANGAFVGVLIVGTSETAGLTGPDAANVVATQSAVHGASPAAIDASTPFVLEVGCAASGPCSLLTSLTAQVQGAELTMSELPQAGQANPDSVALSTVTLSGQFGEATGQLSTVLVTDDRGTLTGWSVIGQLEGPFENTTPTGATVDNQIPADYLTWQPSVSLQVSGAKPSGVLSEVQAGAPSALNDMTGSPQRLCSATAGGGGGSFDCNAAVVLAIPPQIAAGSYGGVIDVVLIGF